MCRLKDCFGIVFSIKKPILSSGLDNQDVLHTSKKMMSLENDGSDVGIYKLLT